MEVRPVAFDEAGFLRYLDPRDAKIAYLWDKKFLDAAHGIQKDKVVEMQFTYGAPALFKPTFPEVLKQMPQNNGVTYVAAEILDHEYRFSDDKMRHVALVQLYIKLEPMKVSTRNVDAIMEWYAQRRPDLLPQMRQIFEGGRPVHDAMQALVLQGFEAGRMFEKEFPEVQSGIGYLNT